MKKQFLLISCIALSASIARSQTQSGAAASGQAGAQTGGATVQQKSGMPRKANSQPGVSRPGANNGVNPGTGSQTGEVATNGVIQEPSGVRISGVIPGNTNRIPFGGTNVIRFGGTNTGNFINDPSGANAGQNAPGQLPPGGNNQIPPATPNRGTGLPTNNTPLSGSGTIREPSGAANPNNPNGVAVPNPTDADAVFARQLKSALARGGATRVLFPQTRSTVTIANQNGSIVLMGVVASQQESRKIQERVKNAAGVVAVHNQLEVRAPKPVVTPGQNPATGAGNTRQLHSR